ncbi:MAG: hypothetical protein JST73_00800, partial [Actinobacteria bacterium]|nr:hypothetical protein [Actinomycetota bacterium]
LDEPALRRLLLDAARWHTDTARAVELAAAGDADRVAVLKAAVDKSLRTRRFLDYRGSTAWAHDARPVVDALTEEVAAAPTAELVTLLQRAAGHLVKVIMHADDSNGTIGDLCRDVLALHRVACTAGQADPTKLAKWMISFTFVDQDFFEIDPVAYLDALGDKGLTVYRREVAERSVPTPTTDVDDDADADTDARPRHDYYGGFPSFAARYANERLAVIDRDPDRIIELFGRDLSMSYHYQRVAEAMIEIGRPDDAIDWARRGIAETTGFQLFKLYDLAAQLLDAAGNHDDVVALRRAQHERMPSPSTYGTYRGVAETAGLWEDEIGWARAVLAAHDEPGYIDALLGDGATSEAWAVARSCERELQPRQWERLAEAREPTDPGDSLTVYLRLANQALEQTDKRAYRAATASLKNARRAAETAHRTEEFTAELAAVRERNRRRPSFIAMLDKAGLG